MSHCIVSQQCCTARSSFSAVILLDTLEIVNSPPILGIEVVTVYLDPIFFFKRLTWNTGCTDSELVVPICMQPFPLFPWSGKYQRTYEPVSYTSLLLQTAAYKVAALSKSSPLLQIWFLSFSCWQNNRTFPFLIASLSKWFVASRFIWKSSPVSTEFLWVDGTQISLGFSPECFIRTVFNCTIIARIVPPLSKSQPFGPLFWSLPNHGLQVLFQTTI